MGSFYSLDCNIFSSDYVALCAMDRPSLKYLFLIILHMIDNVYDW